VAALSHPNILAVYDVGADQGISFVVTELLEGETLRGRLIRARIGWAKAAEIEQPWRTASPPRIRRALSIAT